MRFIFHGLILSLPRTAGDRITWLAAKPISLYEARALMSIPLPLLHCQSFLKRYRRGNSGYCLDRDTALPIPPTRNAALYETVSKPGGLWATTMTHYIKISVVKAGLSGPPS